MLTFSRIRSIFFTVASLTGVFRREGGISRGKSGQFSCRERGSRSHRIKKTSGKTQNRVRVAIVRWRDESVALPDTSEGAPGHPPGVGEPPVDRLLEIPGK